ncbi:hypothetical protein [Cytophaga aurantiaca]|uniref:hypothetical protein n=1 Tax=Cytophaga aurantiaca TaxID=29530 RepID=UPI00036E0280|nr:hypothetical protein [Cytophaga aurantiaca]
MNKSISLFLFCLSICCICDKAYAQIDSLQQSSGRFKRIAAKTDLSAGKIRGFMLGDSIAYVMRTEKAILEAQGDDFLYYRVLCDSILSAEISYTFDEKGLLISTTIEFFESCKRKPWGYLSEEFYMYLKTQYKNCTDKEEGYFECISATGIHIEFQKEHLEMCIIRTQIEFY